MTDPAAIARALEIPLISTLPQRTVDITTLGARSGSWRRIEIWFYRVEGRWFITGRPPRPRSWYANLVAHPEFTFHLKHGVRADLRATAHPVTDPTERVRIFEQIVRSLNDPTNPTPFTNRPPVADWVAMSPLVEVTFDDPAVTP